MRPAALLWGAFVLHRRFPFVKASPLGRGVTKGDGEGKAADGEAHMQRYSYSDKETTSRCAEALLYRACPLRRSRASSPKGRAFWPREGSKQPTKGTHFYLQSQKGCSLMNHKLNLKKQLACIYTNNFFSGLRITDAVWVALLAARALPCWASSLP